jgi:hypothetical protein
LRKHLGTKSYNLLCVIPALSVEYTKIWTALKQIFLISTRFQAVVCEIYFVLSSSKRKRLNRSDTSCCKIFTYGYTLLLQFKEKKNYLREHEDSEYKERESDRTKKQTKNAKTITDHKTQESVLQVSSQLIWRNWFGTVVQSLSKILSALNFLKFFHYTLGNKLVSLIPIHTGRGG